MAERFLGVEEARGQLGRLVDQVADGRTRSHSPSVASLWLSGQPRPVGGSPRADPGRARDELRRRLKQVRRRVSSAGLDPTAVDEAIEAARKVS